MSGSYFLQEVAWEDRGSVLTDKFEKAGFIRMTLEGRDFPASRGHGVDLLHARFQSLQIWKTSFVYFEEDEIFSIPLLAVAGLTKVDLVAMYFCASMDWYPMEQEIFTDRISGAYGLETRVAASIRQRVVDYGLDKPAISDLERQKSLEGRLKGIDKVSLFLGVLHTVFKPRAELFIE